jgi:hypothetical protein
MLKNLDTFSGCWPSKAQQSQPHTTKYLPSSYLNPVQALQGGNAPLHHTTL